MTRASTRVPSHERREQILRVATTLFAKQGFNGITTRQIAERVGVSETILFRLFPSKRELYWAVIDRKRRATAGHATLERQLAKNGDERRMFTAIARDILVRNMNDSTLTRLLLFSGLEEHELSERFFQTYAADYYKTLADYIRRRIRERAYRTVDPVLAARGFVGMVFNYFLVQELFGGKQFQKSGVNKVSATLTGIWLDGMLKRI